MFYPKNTEQVIQFAFLCIKPQVLQPKCSLVQVAPTILVECPSFVSHYLHCPFYWEGRNNTVILFYQNK